MTADRTPVPATENGAPGEGPTSWPGFARARWYAARAGRAIGTEHLLLALTEGTAGPAHDALADLRVTTDAVVAVLWGIQGPDPGPGARRAGGPTLSGRARVVLDRAAASAPGGRPGDEAVLAALVTDPDPALAHLVLVHLEALRTLRRTVDAAGWGAARR